MVYYWHSFGCCTAAHSVTLEFVQLPLLPKLASQPTSQVLASCPFVRSFDVRRRTQSSQLDVKIKFVFSVAKRVETPFPRNAQGEHRRKGITTSLFIFNFSSNFQSQKIIERELKHHDLCVVVEFHYLSPYHTSRTLCPPLAPLLHLSPSVVLG